MSQLPPTESAFDMPMPAEPPAWPKVVGIISIVWASLGLLCGVCGTGWLLYMPTFAKSMEAQMGPMPPAMSPSPAQLALMVLGVFGLVLVLLVASG